MAATEYVTRQQMIAMVPREYIDQALDDEGEGDADAGTWEQIAQAVADAIEGPLSQRYGVPFATPFPRVVREAARVFCAELLFRRRGLSGEQNPWEDQADAMRKRLDSIGAGKQPLSPDLEKDLPSGTVIDEPARTHSAQGRMMI